jgi:uncharacterized membrane protein YfcA
MTELFVAAIVGFAFFMQAAFGFGGGLIATPLLAAVIGAKSAIAVVMVFQFLMGFLIFKLRKDIVRAVFFRLAPALTAGVVAGLLLFSAVNERYLAILLALYVAAYAAADMLNLRGKWGDIVPERIKPWAAGFSGGLIQGLTGTGGPAIIPYIKDNTASLAAFRATVGVALLFLNAVRVAVAGVSHAIEGPVVHYILYAVPLFALALIAGDKVPGFIDRKTANMIINLLLLGSAAAIFVKFR